MFIRNTSTLALASYANSWKQATLASCIYVLTAENTIGILAKNPHPKRRSYELAQTIGCGKRESSFPYQ